MKQIRDHIARDQNEKILEQQSVVEELKEKLPTLILKTKPSKSLHTSHRHVHYETKARSQTPSHHFSSTKENLRFPKTPRKQEKSFPLLDESREQDEQSFGEPSNQNNSFLADDSSKMHSVSSHEKRSLSQKGKHDSA